MDRDRDLFIGGERLRWWQASQQEIEVSKCLKQRLTTNEILEKYFLDEENLLQCHNGSRVCGSEAWGGATE